MFIIGILIAGVIPESAETLSIYDLHNCDNVATPFNSIISLKLSIVSF